MEEKTPNTIIAHHFHVKDDEVIINPNDYYWHIPKDLRKAKIKPGDVARVPANNQYVLVIVTKVFREEIEETGRFYLPVISKISHNKNYKKKKKRKTEEIKISLDITMQ